MSRPSLVADYHQHPHNGPPNLSSVQRRVAQPLIPIGRHLNEQQKVAHLIPIPLSLFWLRPAWNCIGHILFPIR